jgi:hypothetical protein
MVKNVSWIDSGAAARIMEFTLLGYLSANNVATTPPKL